MVLSRLLGNSRPGSGKLWNTVVTCVLLICVLTPVEPRPGWNKGASPGQNKTSERTTENSTTTSVPGLSGVFPEKSDIEQGSTDKPVLYQGYEEEGYVYGGIDLRIPDKNRKVYRFGIISDLDAHSADSTEKAGSTWLSYLREGNLFLELDRVHPYWSNISIEWDDSATHTIKSGLAYSGRGMELSTLNNFKGRLLSCDDRTGVIYELIKDKFTHDIIPTPFAILANGNYSGMGFKCEWASVKDDHLYVGGNGRDLPGPYGKRIKTQKWVKEITSDGEVSHIDWSEKYDRMEEALYIQYPGFIMHEAAGWSEILKKWIFMPRYISREEYDYENVRYAGSNVAFVADENFNIVHVQQVGKIKPTRSFSSFKWIPGTDDQLILALKTLELEDEQETYIMAFDIKGNIIMKETKIADQKFEGIEFL